MRCYVVDGSMTGSQEENSPGSTEMRRVLLANAREALSKYLTVEREKRLIRSAKNDLHCEVIDTCLLKIYMSQKDDASMYKFLQQPNDCNIDDCSKALYKAKV